MTHRLLPGLERAREIVGQSAWKHEGDDAYSQGLDRGAVQQVHESIKALDAAIAEAKASVEAERRYEERYAALVKHEKGEG